MEILGEVESQSRNTALQSPALRAATPRARSPRGRVNGETDRLGSWAYC